MKKIFFILLLLCLFNPVYASDDVLDSIVDSYTKVMPFYQKLSNCTPYTNNYHGMVYKIYGLSNNSCHMSIASYDCYLPRNIYPTYSSRMVQVYNKKIMQAKSGRFYASSAESEAQYGQNILNTYCKIKLISQ